MTDKYASKPAPDKKSGFYYGYVIVGASFFILIINACVNCAFGIFFKPIITDLSWTRTIISGAFSLCWIVTGGASIAAGALSDKLGARFITTVCSLFLCLGLILMSLMTEIWHLYLFYGVFVAFGMSMFIAVMSITTRWFTTNRNTMTGIIVAGAGIGTFIGPPLADKLILSYDWRVACIIFGCMVLLLLTPAAQLLRREPAYVDQDTPSRKMDTPLQQIKSETNDFSLRQAAATKQFWLAFFMFFSSGYSMWSIQLHLAPHITDLGLSSTTAAFILAMMGAGSVFGRIGLGTAGDKIGNKRTFIIIFILTAFALTWLIFSTEVWQFLLFAAIFGISYGGSIAQQPTLVAYLFGIKSLGLLYGVIGVGFTVGAAIGPLISGYIFDINASYQIAFIINVIVTILGLLLTTALKPMSSSQARTTHN